MIAAEVIKVILTFCKVRMSNAKMKNKPEREHVLIEKVLKSFFNRRLHKTSLSSLQARNFLKTRASIVKKDRNVHVLRNFWNSKWQGIKTCFTIKKTVRQNLIFFLNRQTTPSSFWVFRTKRLKHNERSDWWRVFTRARIDKLPFFLQGNPMTVQNAYTISTRAKGASL